VWVYMCVCVGGEGVCESIHTRHDATPLFCIHPSFSPSPTHSPPRGGRCVVSPLSPPPPLLLLPPPLACIVWRAAASK
jgi:hypothetical protein